MATPLGHAVGTPVIMHFKNTATAAITKGMALGIESGATIPTGDPQTHTADFGTNPPTNPPVLPVTPYLTSSSITNFCGVAMEDVPVNGIGRMVVYGPVLAQTGTDIAVHEAIQADGTDATFLDYASGDKHGMALEAGSASVLTWVFVTPPAGLGAA